MLPGLLPLFLHTVSDQKLDSTANGTRLGVVLSRPQTKFFAHPADSSKNRVWTLSLRKLGQVYIWRAVNWVIVGVNYIISNQQHLLWCQKNLQAGYLWWRIMQFTLPEQSDWCDNMTLRSYNYAPVLPVKVSRPNISTRLQGAHEKFGAWGRD